MTRHTITDTAAGHLIADGLDKYDAADALRAEFADAPAEVQEQAEHAAEALENGTRPTDAECAFLAIEIEVA